MAETIKPNEQNDPATATDALKFVMWYRRMCIEGQITHTDYAVMKRPCSDFILQQRLEVLQARLKKGQVVLEAPPMREFVELIARMKTEAEFGGDAPPSEDWICTLNELIESARQIVRKT